MKPNSVASRLRQIATKIENSKSPRRDLVAEDLQEVLQKLETPPSLTREEVAKMCPSCAEKMASMGITKISSEAIMRAIVSVDLPKGWTEESAKKWWHTTTKGAEHKKTKCMDAIKGKVSDPGAFCNWMAHLVDYKPSK